MKDLVQQRQEAAFGGACLMGVLAALMILVGAAEPARTATTDPLAAMESVDLTVHLKR